MNIIEQMMVEHAAIRLHLRSIRSSPEGSEAIYDLDEFVVKCHSRIEDEVVFPRLREIARSSGLGENLEQTISRLEADHKLIQKISGLIRTLTEKGDKDILRKRTMLYCTTLETHNLDEESMIFPYWTSGSDEKILSQKCRRIIDEYGRDRYFRITGVSEKLFELFG